jgi:hypothetical protein
VTKSDSFFQKHSGGRHEVRPGDGLEVTTAAYVFKGTDPAT